MKMQEMAAAIIPGLQPQQIIAANDRRPLSWSPESLAL